MNVVLVLTFVQAPFQHVHEHEITQRHSHGFLHTHFPHYRFSASKSAHFDDLDPDEDAHFQDWYATTVSDHAVLTYVQVFSYSFKPIWSSESHVEPLILSG